MPTTPSRLTGLVEDRSIGYDADNRPVTVAANGNTTSYLYSPDGSRLKKAVGATYVVILEWGNCLAGDGAELPRDGHRLPGISH